MVGLLCVSSVELRVRLDPLLDLTRGSAVTLYVVVVTGPAELTEVRLLRGLIISRREVGTTCLWCSWTGEAYRLVGSDALAGWYMTGDRGRTYPYLSPILTVLLCHRRVLRLVFISVLEKVATPIIGLR